MASLAVTYAVLSPLIGPIRLVLDCFTAWLRYHKRSASRRRAFAFEWRRIVFLWGAFEKEALKFR
jgi:hypothetical protein